MGLTTTKRSLQLDHRVAAFASQALSHRAQQQAHAFGNKGASKELLGILIFDRGLAVGHLGDIGRKFRLLEGAFQHIAMRARNLAPGLKTHDVVIPLLSSSLLV
ncbi:hypothetical protein D3C84_1015060 [compost metagenome]